MQDLQNPVSSRKIVKSFEAKALSRRNLPQKIADYLATSFGSVFFLSANVFIFFIWILINSGVIAQIPPFDPFPFPLLTTAVSLEAIFLSIIVLMSQNRQSFINSLREELDLQVNLIAEAEITKILKLVNEIHKHQHVNASPDPELEKMIKQIDTSYIVRKLTEQMTESQNSPIFKDVKKK